MTEKASGIYGRRLFVKKLRPNAILPTRAHPTDVGYDLYTTSRLLIMPGKTEIINTGVAVFHEPVNGMPVWLMIADRSSVPLKYQLHVCGGIIDASYRGEIKIVMHNLGNKSQHIEEGQKVAQIIPMLMVTSVPHETNELPASDRGEDGFGSTDKPKVSIQ